MGRHLDSRAVDSDLDPLWRTGRLVRPPRRSGGPLFRSVGHGVTLIAVQWSLISSGVYQINEANAICETIVLPSSSKCGGRHAFAAPVGLTLAGDSACRAFAARPTGSTAPQIALNREHKSVQDEA